MRSLLHKKGDLSLSVNSIVIFVLAFALLGVGLFVTNLIQDKISGGILDVVDVTDLANKPDAANPLTVSKELNLKTGGSLKLVVGYYNVGPSQATNVGIDIIECVGGGQTVTPPIVDSATFATIDIGEGKGFNIIVEDVQGGQLIPGSSYICTLAAGNRAGGAAIQPGSEYESKQFFLNVVS